MQPEFKAFPKIARYSRDVIVTEKLDGTNAQIFITDDGKVFAGSRTRWITPEDDNYGFAKWVQANEKDLLLLGPGQHFGEWWGKGIQRGYGMDEKKFSLFNTTRWLEHPIPECCWVVPELYRGPLSDEILGGIMNELKDLGSYANPGFMDPEGIVIFHTASNQLYKKTLKDDEKPKSLGVANGNPK